MDNLVIDREAGVYRFTEGGKSFCYPSVTEVLQLLRRLAGEHDADEAELLRGRYVHKACALLLGGLDGSGLAWETVDPSLHGYLQAWEKFTANALCALTTPFVVDIKTGHSVSVIEGPQTAAYLYAWKETHIISPGIEVPLRSHKFRYAGMCDYLCGFTPTRKAFRYTVHLHDDSTYKLREYPDHAEDFSVFLACLHLYNYLLKKGKNHA